MTIREETEAIERQTLSSCATLSANSLGRRLPLTEDPIRPCFQRDRDRILHCKAFRRLKQKTQVFLSPEGDHYRTRLTHTLEVSQIARTVSRALRLIWAILPLAMRVNAPLTGFARGALPITGRACALWIFSSGTGRA